MKTKYITLGLELPFLFIGYALGLLEQGETIRGYLLILLMIVAIVFQVIKTKEE